jgi:23S rRNA (uracil1939-C5)-methyltransferase
MARKSKVIPSLTITDIADEGKALGRFNDMVVFVDRVVPGDVVEAYISRKKKNYAEARVTKVLEKSALRTAPICSHFGVCGGCKWQFLAYENQLKFKEKTVFDAIRRIGGVEPITLNNILGSEDQYFYRNKLEFTFSNNRWLTVEEVKERDNIDDRNALGFHIPGMFDKIVDIEKCYLQAEPSNEIRNFIKDFALQKDFTFFDLVKQKGLLRNLIIRTALTGKNMVIVVFFENDMEKISYLMNELKEKFDSVSSWHYIINEKKNDSIHDQEVIHFAGKDHIIEKMGELNFKISPKSFFQVNVKQAVKLYDIAKNLANISSEDVVYDLYTGTGTIANYVAKDAKKVVGIEYIDDAIKDAKINSTLNGISNTDFYAGDMKDVLNDEFIRKNGKPNIIITDPPRAGMHEDVVKKILEIAPEKVVYVSCNAATQARDIAWMKHLYEITEIQPVDMFPQTHHVENVALLTKKK